MDGIIVINKEQDYTSFDVVAKLRGILKEKKIGHTGTLDPMATGVLPVCLGAGTKLVDRMTDSVKIYRAVMLLGEDYDTEDVTGNLLAKADVKVTEEQIRECAASFVGELEQLPPMYSAVKVNGKKLCDYARAGKEVERRPRKVVIHDISVEEINLPYVTIQVECSKGTYIRTLCREIGEKLGCHGCMSELVRTYTGGFSIEEAKTIDEVIRYRDEGRLSEILHGVDSFFRDLPEGIVCRESEKYAENGNAMMIKEFDRFVLPKEKDGETSGGTFEKDEVSSENASKNIFPRIRMYSANRYFYGIYRFDGKRNLYVPEKMFFCQCGEET